MLPGKYSDQQQAELFKNLRVNQFNTQHPLYLTVQFIPWKILEEAFAPQLCNKYYVFKKLSKL